MNLRLCSIAAILAMPALLSGQDFRAKSFPARVMESVIPEEMVELTYPAYFNDLDRARMQAFHGRYKLALQTLLRVKDGDTSLVRATALAGCGRVDEAIAAAQSSTDPRARELLVQLLVDSGRPDDALSAARELVKTHPESVVGRMLLGSILESTGDIEGAKAAYRWFVEPPQQFVAKLSGGVDPELAGAADWVAMGTALDRWATLTGAYQSNEALHHLVYNVFVKAYDKIDRGYWPARVAAAEFALNHDDSKKAVDELEVAIDANPNDARTLELLGQVALSEFNFDDCDRASAQMRRSNPDSLRADLLEARSSLHQRRPLDAEPLIRRALRKEPRNTEALGLLAAFYALRLQDEQLSATLKQVDAINPHNATAYLEVAEQLGAMRQYPRAAAMYQVAIDRAPWFTSARNGLGLLYTQSGDEDLARATLEAAHSIDPFNLKTTNYLRLLDDLATFARRETQNFIVFYDAKLDPVIPDYFADYLESIHTDVCAYFKFSPTVKTYIEVFPTHDAFSVRTTGSPWIGTVGASTGRVIALCAPRGGKQTLGTFNWAQVLRHEYTHTVTLGKTDNRIPHWMTEGLAVRQERAPLRWEWVPMLYDAVKNDTLFTIDGLTWGFVRPKKPSDRQLAYAQSAWVCQYIDEQWGHDVILQMLDLFRAGLAQEEVFPKLLGKDLDAFHEGFKQWTRAQVATWGYDEQTSQQYNQLREEAEKLVAAREFEKALPLWEQIAAIRPVDAMPQQRLAGLYLQKSINQPEKAAEHLKRLATVEIKDNRFAKRLARLYRDQQKWSDCRQWALDAVYIDPYDIDAHKLLLEAARQLNDSSSVDRETRVIRVLEQWKASQEMTDQ